MGARNGVNTGGIEHKMGIKGQATCVLNFDDAIAWRLGPKPEPLKPGEKRSSSAGMAGMFGMMNAARLGVGMQGIAIGEVAYQNGYAYAHERRVGRALTGPKEPDKPADLEIVHPDVKRMLLHCRAFVEGARALACWTALNMSIAHSKRADAAAAAPAGRSDDAGAESLLHRYGLRGRQSGHAMLWRPWLYPRQWRGAVRARWPHQPDL